MGKLTTFRIALVFPPVLVLAVIWLFAETIHSLSSAIEDFLMVLMNAMAEWAHARSQSTPDILRSDDCD